VRQGAVAGVADVDLAGVLARIVDEAGEAPTGREGWATSSIGTRPTIEIGARSFSAS
jgi:hypothetical protein